MVGEGNFGYQAWVLVGYEEALTEQDHVGPRREAAHAEQAAQDEADAESGANDGEAPSGPSACSWADECN
jgi:hypothetical protein